MQMMRVEFKAREGEDQRPLRTGDLRHPLGDLLKLTIPYVVREVTTVDSAAALRATPVSDEETEVLVEAVEAYGKKTPQRSVDMTLVPALRSRSTRRRRSKARSR